MLFRIVRLLFLFIALLCLFILTNKYVKKHKRQLIVLVTIAVLCLDLLGTIFPFENLFFYFPSPDKAFSYFNTGEIIGKMDGEESTLILYRDDRIDGFCILPKYYKGWQFRPFLSYDTVYQKKLYSQSVNCDIKVYRAKNTTDYYVAVDNWFVDNPINISDNRGSEFLCIAEESSIEDVNFYSYYTYIEELNDGYKIKVGDVSVLISLDDTKLERSESE